MIYNVFEYILYICYPNNSTIKVFCYTNITVIIILINKYGCLNYELYYNCLNDLHNSSRCGWCDMYQYLNIEEPLIEILEVILIQELLVYCTY